MRSCVVPPSPPLRVTVTPGVVASRSETVSFWLARTCSGSINVTEVPMRDSGCSMRFAVTMTRSSSSEPEASAKAHAGASRHDRTNGNEDDEVDDRTDMTRKLRKNCQPFHPQVSQFGRGEPEGPVAARELPLAQHTPADRWTTAASRSPGSWLGVRRVTFPDRQLPADPVVSTRGAPLTVAGAARASHPVPI